MATAFSNSAPKKLWTKPIMTKLEGEEAEKAKRVLLKHSGNEFDNSSIPVNSITKLV